MKRNACLCCGTISREFVRTKLKILNCLGWCFFVCFSLVPSRMQYLNWFPWVLMQLCGTQNMHQDLLEKKSKCFYFHSNSIAAIFHQKSQVLNFDCYSSCPAETLDVQGSSWPSFMFLMCKCTSVPSSVCERRVLIPSGYGIEKVSVVSKAFLFPALYILSTKFRFLKSQFC